MNDPTTKLSLKAVGLMFVAALAFGACGSSSTSAAAPEASSEATTPAAAPEASSEATTPAAAPEASSEATTPAAAAIELPTTAVLPTVSGSQVDFGAIGGQDTVLWFWAPW